MAKEQRDFERGLLAEDRAAADADYRRRLGIVDTLRSNADFSPEFYDQQIGGATAQARSSVAKAGDIQARNLSRMGVNPNSGRMAGIGSRMALTGAALEATAANQTRQGLGMEERSRRDAAEYAGLGVSPAFVGRGVNDNVANVLGGHAADKSAHAAALRQQAANSMSGFMSGIGTLGGIALTGVTGGASAPMMAGGGGASPMTLPSQDVWGGQGLDLSWNR